MDRDGDGFIDADEVDYILSNLAIPFDAADLMTLMEERGGKQLEHPNPDPEHQSMRVLKYNCLDQVQ